MNDAIRCEGMGKGAKVAGATAGVGIVGAIATAVLVDVSKDKIKEAFSEQRCAVSGTVYEAKGRPLPAIWVQIHNDWRATQPVPVSTEYRSFKWEGECAGVEGSRIHFSRGGIACPLESKSVIYKVDVELPPLTVDLDQLKAEACSDKKTKVANSNPAKPAGEIEKRGVLIGSWRSADDDQWAIEFRSDGSWKNTNGGAVVGTGIYTWIDEGTVKLSSTQESVPLVMEWRVQINGDVLQTADDQQSAKWFRTR